MAPQQIAEPDGTAGYQYVMRLNNLILNIIFVCVIGTQNLNAASPKLSGNPILRIEIWDVHSPEPNRPSKTISVCTIDGNESGDRQFMEELWKDYGPAFGFKDWNNFGPDSDYRSIVFVRKGQTVQLKSWHPIIERNEKMVVTSQGVENLDNRLRSEVLKADDPTYLVHREAFDALVSKCLSRAVPNKSSQPALPRQPGGSK